MIFALAAIAFALALLPAACFFRNLRLYAPPRMPEEVEAARLPGVSVLIPARNEAGNIREAILAALEDQGVAVEVVVLDDESDDGTAGIVEGIARERPGVRLVRGAPLPPGWSGKQHACRLLAGFGRSEVLVFQDADVRLEPKACARMAAFLEGTGASLASGIPRQEVGSFLEKLLIPLIHFVALAFLPIWRMRRSRHPAYGAGCGQLFAARRADYEAAGGHAAIRASLHDGVALPRAFRAAGFATDLFDATPVARCRMYRSGREVWRGLARNATEGLGSPGLIVPATALLLGGQVLPFALLAASPWLLLGPPAQVAAVALAAAAAAAGLWVRLAAARRFAQPVASAILHPVGIALLVAIQWHALARRLLRRPSRWRGRSYGAAA